VGGTSVTGGHGVVLSGSSSAGRSSTRPSREQPYRAVATRAPAGRNSDVKRGPAASHVDARSARLFLRVGPPCSKYMNAARACGGVSAFLIVRFRSLWSGHSAAVASLQRARAGCPFAECHPHRRAACITSAVLCSFTFAVAVPPRRFASRKKRFRSCSAPNELAERTCHRQSKPCSSSAERADH
jgi:hypothetical protein